MQTITLITHVVLLLLTTITTLTSASSNSSSGSSILGSYQSIAISSSSQPVIVYNSQVGTKLLVCESTTCDARETYILDCESSIQSSSIVVPYGGYPILGFARTSNSLKPEVTLRECGSRECLIGEDIEVDPSSSDAGYHLNMISYGDGLAMTYIDRGNAVVKLVICSDLLCATKPNVQTIASLTTMTSFGETSIEVGVDLQLMVAFHDWQGASHAGVLEVVHCANTQCTSRQTSHIFGVSEFSSMRLLSGVPWIAYVAEDYGQLMLATCRTSLNCTSPNIQPLQLDSQYTSLAFVRLRMVPSTDGYLEPLIVLVTRQAVLGVTCPLFRRLKCSTPPTTTVFDKPSSGAPWLINSMRVSVTVTSDSPPRPLIVYNIAMSQRSLLVLIRCRSSTCLDFDRIILDDRYAETSHDATNAIDTHFVAIAMPIVLIVLLVAAAIGFGFRGAAQNFSSDVHTPFLTTAEIDPKFRFYYHVSIVVGALSCLVALLPWVVFFNNDIKDIWHLFITCLTLPLVSGVLVSWVALHLQRPYIHLVAVGCATCTVVMIVLSASVVSSMWKQTCVLPGLQAPTALSTVGLVALVLYMLFVVFQNSRLFMLQIWLRRQRVQRQTSFMVVSDRNHPDAAKLLARTNSTGGSSPLFGGGGGGGGKKKRSSWILHGDGDD